MKVQGMGGSSGPAASVIEGRRRRGVEISAGKGRLFEADDCGVGGFAFGAGGLEVVVDLAAAEEERLLGLKRFRSVRTGWKATPRRQGAKLAGKQSFWG
jgi:hypothetical protein